MKKVPSFAEGVLVAFLAAAMGAVMFGGATLMVPAEVAAAWVLMALGLGYVLYLVGRAHPSAGRSSMLLLWLIVTGAVWSLSSDLRILAVSQLMGLWLVRSLCFQCGPIAALMDLGLMLIGALAALWVTMRTGSPFLAIWTLFLVQALFVSIPPLTKQNPSSASHSADFDRAERTAERALRRLSRSE
ncbi:hypothetical protein [Imhoffiella purpurea]|uniref:Uncharacterized protein n=1 Tax=Imhoffiella purpurea TaxID=1249627 RepID=W9VB94_9GAMM|nr:hypothetical protein [Imhoffiella purpurea]EXJ14231.1 hypothetical protein D779_2902 [Imhoffiella purpurea]